MQGYSYNSHNKIYYNIDKHLPHVFRVPLPLYAVK